MTNPITTRLFFADGHSELVDMPARQARRDRYSHPVITGTDKEYVHWRSVVFARRELCVPPDFVGPLPSNDVYVEHDLPGRAAMERQIGADAVRRGIGPSREGWRSVAVFVEIEP